VVCPRAACPGPASRHTAESASLNAIGRASFLAAYLRGRSNDWFYFCCAWLITAAVTYGFAHTISDNLLHAAVPRPRILWIHAGVFFGWVGLFMLQIALIRSRCVGWHRRLGVAGLILGAMMPALGIATAVVMGRFDVAQGLRDSVYVAAHLSIPFNDMIVFAGVFAAAVWWRNRPDVHRRLMLVATCSLTAAAFARFPFITITELRWYAGVDVLLLFALAHDLAVQRRVHIAYAISLPPVLIGQIVAMWLFLARPHWWVEFARRLIAQTSV
jgi:hypothetical protein